MHNTFSIKDLGNFYFSLEIEVQPQATRIHLSQSRYIKTILEKANMLGVNSCTTRLQAAIQLSKSVGTLLEDPSQYHSILGALQYTNITYPDLTYSVNKASHFFCSTN
jgi:hypothetical protein